MLPLGQARPTQLQTPSASQSAQQPLSALFFGLSDAPTDTLDHGAAGAMPPYYAPPAPQAVPPAPVRRLVPKDDERDCYTEACANLIFGYPRAARQGYQAQITRACAFLGEDPKAIYPVLESLAQPHNAQASHKKDDALRTRALALALEAHSATMLQSGLEQIVAARKMPWTRLVAFSGSVTLVGLKDASVTGSLACATYLAAQAAVSGAASIKGAAVMAKAKGAALAATSTVAAGALGVATGLATAYTMAEFYDCITAFRDVWDNDFGRDAYFLHQIVKHQAVAQGDDSPFACVHADDEAGNGGWTNPVLRTLAWRKGRI